MGAPPRSGRQRKAKYSADHTARLLDQVICRDIADIAKELLQEGDPLHILFGHAARERDDTPLF